MRARVRLLADQPGLALVVVDWLHREWFQHLGLSLEQSEAVVRGRASGRLPLALVAMAGDEPVGTASLIEDVPPDDWTAVPFLAGVYVVPAWRGRGVGTRLCRRAVAEARHLGQGRLHLLTPTHEAFYARLGWQAIVATVLETGATHQAVTFMKRAV